MDGTYRSDPYLTGNAPWCLKTDIRLLPRAVVCRVSGEVDGDTAPLLARSLNEALLRARPARQLRAELPGVTLLTTAGVTVLVRLRESAAAAGVPLVLVTPSAQVLRVLALTGTGPLFTVRPSIRPNPPSAVIDRALREARNGLAAGTWLPTGRDRAAVAALLPELRWTTPPQLPSLPPLHVRAGRLQDVVAELAVAALTTQGELSALLSRCVGALTPADGTTDGDEAPDGPGVADDSPSPAELSDVEAALARLFGFLQLVAQPL